MKIAYLTHPVDAERKANLNADGFRIVDVKFQPEKIGKDDMTDAKPAKADRPKLSVKTDSKDA